MASAAPRVAAARTGGLVRRDGTRSVRIARPAADNGAALVADPATALHKCENCVGTGQPHSTGHARAGDEVAGRALEHDRRTAGGQHEEEGG